MTTPPGVRPLAPEAEHATFTASVLSLMRALLAAKDPGVDAVARIPQARLGEPATGSPEAVRSPHIRVDI
jgi:hypothetical protein